MAFEDGDVLDASLAGGGGARCRGPRRGGVAGGRVSGAAHRVGAAGRSDAGDDAVPHGDGRDLAAGGGQAGAGPLLAEHRGGDEPAGRSPVLVRGAHTRVPDAHDDPLLPRSLEVDLGEGDRALGVDGLTSASCRGNSSTGYPSWQRRNVSGRTVQGDDQRRPRPGQRRLRDGRTARPLPRGRDQRVGSRADPRPSWSPRVTRAGRATPRLPTSRLPPRRRCTPSARREPRGG
jgi:hypothetical protein